MSLRILHTPVNVANDAWSMSRAERGFGHESTLAVVQENRYAHTADVDLGFPDYHPLVRPLARRLRKTGFALSAPWRYDLIVYEFATSIIDFHRPGLDLLDLRFARHGRATIAAVFHGCDVRAAAGVCAFCPTPCDVERVRDRLDIVRSSADLLYVKTPDLLQAVPEASYLPQAVFGLEDVDSIPPRATETLRIVHGPSAPELKGTAHVIEAVRSLQSDGADIDLVLVQNMSHADALRAYRDADLAIDQLLVGWYGVFAVEMMAMAKPVICRIDVDALERSGISDLPIVDADPSTLRLVLADLISDRERLRSIGVRSREWALEHHDAVKLAGRLLADFDGLRAKWSAS